MGAAEGVFIVLEEVLGSGELRFRKPRVLFRGVAFPSDKVLPLGWNSFVTNDLFNFIMFFIIDEIWGWRWEVPARMKGAGAGGWNGEKQGTGRVSVDLVLLARCTASDMTLYIRGKAQPPKFQGDKLAS